MLPRTFLAILATLACAASTSSAARTSFDHRHGSSRHRSIIEGRRHGASLARDLAPSAQEQSRSDTAIAARSPLTKRGWSLTQEASGDSFFNSFNFFSGEDPTHGTVAYQSREEAGDAWLSVINPQGRAILAVDWQNQTISGGRKSVRLSSTWTFEVGSLVVADIYHMPTGVGSWPAFWTLGNGVWPSTGEIDIIEGVNGVTSNQASIHTAPGCSIPSEVWATNQLVTGNFDATDCSAAATGNQGCGQRVPVQDTRAYGQGFNDGQGGVYAMSITDEGIAINFFARSDIPDDIHSDSPDPSSWGTPQAQFPSTSCDMRANFQSHSVLFDTTFCGDWAGSSGAWKGGSSGSGEFTPPAEVTGYDDCAAYVQNEGSNFETTYWEIASVKLFTQN